MVPSSLPASVAVPTAAVLARPMRGIILAGGTGSRLWPITRAVSKQLMPVYDKPMIYYPLSTLMMAGIREILVITTPEDQAQFQRLLGDGSPVRHLDLELRRRSRAPDGLAQAFIIGADFIGDEPVALVLGDNIFYGAGLGRQLARPRPTSTAATSSPTTWPTPTAYGVVEFDADGTVALDRGEAGRSPSRRYAVPGLYFYDNDVVEIAADLKPSARGELEITAVNDAYLRPRPAARSPCSTAARPGWTPAPSSSLMQAAEFVRVIEERQGLQDRLRRGGRLARRASSTDDQLRALAEPLLQERLRRLPARPARRGRRGGDA